MARTKQKRGGLGFPIKEHRALFAAADSKAKELANQAFNALKNENCDLALEKLSDATRMAGRANAEAEAGLISADYEADAAVNGAKHLLRQKCLRSESDVKLQAAKRVGRYDYGNVGGIVGTGAQLFGPSDDELPYTGRSEEEISQILKELERRREKRRRSLTFGTFPSRVDYDNAFDAATADSKYRFHFGNDKRVGNAELSRNELWSELHAAMADFNNGDMDAGDWANAVMSVLGFEWI